MIDGGLAACEVEASNGVVVVAGFSGSWWVVLQLGTDGVCWLLGQRAWVDGLPFVGLICMGIDRWFFDVGLAKMWRRDFEGGVAAGLVVGKYMVIFYFFIFSVLD